MCRNPYHAPSFLCAQSRRKQFLCLPSCWAALILTVVFLFFSKKAMCLHRSLSQKTNAMSTKSGRGRREGARSQEGPSIPHKSADESNPPPWRHQLQLIWLQNTSLCYKDKEKKFPAPKEQIYHCLLTLLFLERTKTVFKKQSPRWYPVHPKTKWRREKEELVVDKVSEFLIIN